MFRKDESSYDAKPYVTKRAIEIEILYNNTSKNRLLSLGPPFCYAQLLSVR
jgi:hypothetical protein